MASNKPWEFKAWYRPQYLISACHVCKRALENRMHTCTSCGLVAYCCTEHLEEDMDDHFDICDALKEAARVLGSEKAHDKAYLLGPNEWREFRLGLAGMCSRYLGRPLQPWELEICLFPPLCATCHKFSAALEICSECLYTSWCTPQHRPVDHSEHCHSLRLYGEILHRKVRSINTPSLDGVPATMDALSSKKDRDEVSFSLLSEIATSPLTILSALPETTDVIVHIIGPEPHFEANNLSKWEAFLFNLRPSMAHLTLNFVGPEIGPLPTRTSTKNDRTLKCTFHELLYHDFVGKKEYQKPNLICALNPGLYRPHGFNGQDTWAATINAMFKYEDVPVLVTAYTKKEAGLDYERVKKQIPNVKTIIEPSRNPFSSLRPLMNFVSDESTPVVFKNAYRTVLSI